MVRDRRLQATEGRDEEPITGAQRREKELHLHGGELRAVFEEGGIGFASKMG